MNQIENNVTCINWKLEQMYETGIWTSDVKKEIDVQLVKHTSQFVPSINQPRNKPDSASDAWIPTLLCEWTNNHNGNLWNISIWNVQNKTTDKIKGCL